ncbi:MAG TPA: hypothetical protein VKC66_01390 [Xanthobacteraceae bacterium]|nr:hypothetical protein [Xanthobacteraceae bacterium]
MVTRTQIAEADVTGWSGVIYTCNCGYFDLGHGNPHKAAWNVGASALWEQLVKEPSDNAVVEQFRRPPMGEPGAGAANAMFWLLHDPTARFPDGAPGFAVEYQQDMGRRIAGLRVTPAAFNRRYLVRRGLSTEEKKAVALAIFIEVTMGFEHLQGEWPWGWIPQSAQSSFSLEDTVSDLIGFYIAIGEITRADALAACHPCSVAASLAMWDGNPHLASLKNQTFKPVLLNDTRVRYAAGNPSDECTGQARMFPFAFQRIKPAPKGQNFIDMPYAPDLHRRP